MRYVLGVLLACGFLNAEVGPPRLGFVVYPDGSLRPLEGVAGVLVPGERVLSEVAAASFNGTFGFALTGTEVVVFDDRGLELARRARPAGAAIFGAASVYFPEADERWSWRRGRFVIEAGALPDAPPLLFDGDVAVVRGSGARLRLGFRPAEVAWAGAGVLVAAGEGRRALLRVTPSREAVYAIPEAVR